MVHFDKEGVGNQMLRKYPKSISLKHNCSSTGTNHWWPVCEILQQVTLGIHTRSYMVSRSSRDQSQIIHKGLMKKSLYRTLWLDHMFADCSTCLYLDLLHAVLRIPIVWLYLCKMVFKESANMSTIHAIIWITHQLAAALQLLLISPTRGLVVTKA